MSDTTPADPAPTPAPAPPAAAGAPESDAGDRRDAPAAAPPAPAAPATPAAPAAPRAAGAAGAPPAAGYAGGGRERRDGPPGDRREMRGRSRQGRPFYRKKFCKFCARSGSGKVLIDYKDFDTLRRFTTDRGKILPRRVTGNCAKCQRKLSAAVKRARALALLPFAAR